MLTSPVAGEMVVGVSRCCCFFFQAEDGIRDLTVTGVQTCALPIWNAPPVWRRLRRSIGQWLGLSSGNRAWRISAPFGPGRKKAMFVQLLHWLDGSEPDAPRLCSNRSETRRAAGPAPVPGALPPRTKQRFPADTHST